MTEIEIAAGAVLAAQNAAFVAMKRNQDMQQFGVAGSRSLTCANANAALLKEAVEACELAARKLLDAAARHARMCES